MIGLEKALISQHSELTPNSLLHQIQQHFCIDELSAPLKFAVAFSGGNDSVALLHCLHSIESNNIHCRAVHINHDIQQQSNDWQLWCENFCHQHAIDFTKVSVTVPRRGNLENNARHQRYLALKNTIKPDEVLLTAHHLDDQMITMLMRLMKGTSIRGMVGIQADSKLFGMQVFRPLLSWLKQDLSDYNQRHHLTWLEDPSNTDMAIERNLFKLQILPVLKQSLPRFSATANITSQHFLEQKALLDEVASATYGNLNKNHAYSMCSLDIGGLEQLSIPSLKNLLIHLSAMFKLELGTVHITHIIENLQRYFTVRQNNFIVLNWQQTTSTDTQAKYYFFHIYNQCLHLYCRNNLSFQVQKIDTTKNSYGLDNHGELSWSNIPQSVQKDLYVMPISLLGKVIWHKRGTLKRKNIVQELAIPPWQRDSQPVIVQLPSQPLIEGKENYQNIATDHRVELVSIPNYVDIYGKWNYVTQEYVC